MERPRLSEKCINQAKQFELKGLSFHELSKELGVQSAAFFSLLLTLPFLLWVAFPGLSLIFGVLLVINGVQIAFKKGVWIPRFLGRHRISGAHLSKALQMAARWLKPLERFVRPRLEIMQNHPIFRVVTGIEIALSGLFLSLPYPPGTNFPPALGVAILAVGLLEEDGVVTLVGYALFLLNTLFYIVLPIYGIRYLLRVLY